MMCSGLEYLDEPRELERLATPFGGGMHMGDHCGFYCAGLMLIGLACAGLPDGKKASASLQRSFTAEWKKSWPLLCREIRAAQKAGKIKGGCASVGKGAGKTLGGLLRPSIGNPQRARFKLKARKQS
jgi:hypothetical protein